MNENEIIENQTEEATADQSDPFLEGFDLDEADVVDQHEQQSEEQTEETEEATEDTGEAETEEETEDTTEEATEGNAEQKAEEAPEELSWELKTIDGRRTMKAEEVTPELLQKGLDYDRVRTKYDEGKDVVAFFSEQAKKNGKTLPEYLDVLKTAVKMQENEGMTEEQAQRELDLEKREAAVSAKEEAEKGEAKAEDDKQAAIAADLEEFSRAFPDEYAKMAADGIQAIPQEVWDYAETHHISLTAAFSYHMAEQAKAEAQAAVAAATANAKNTQRSTGSMSTSGGNKKVKVDPFLAGWDADDA